MQATARPRLFVFALVAPLALGAGLVPIVVAAPSAAAVSPVANPPIEESCGLDLTLVLDASGSVSSSHAVEDVRDAGDALLTALTNTNSTARVTQFASLSQLLADRTLVDDASMADGGVHSEALQGYYNPIPPRPSNVNIYSYRGSGSPQSSSSFSSANSSNQYTNWDQGLHQAGSGAELMVFVTDGDPTGYDFDQPGDPFRAQDVAVNTNRGSANQLTMDRAVDEANAIKTSDTRMLAVGVGSALSNSDSVNRLVQISGPQVVRDAQLDAVDSLNDIDVALVTDFEDLAQFMRSLVLQLCSPSLTVRKLAQTADDATYQPEQGRQITVTPTIPGGSGFTWILPNTTPAPSKTQPTDVNGFAQFQWEPIPPEEDSVATVAEATSAVHTPGRPGPDNDYRCELRNEDGGVRVVEDDFADLADPEFVLDPIGQEIVTCTIWNSFDYEPDIELAKVNAPTEVRGDLTPPAQVTSSYTATNPGNTPLADVSVVDDRCGPVLPVSTAGANVGDTTPKNGLLDPGEAWRFTCSQPVQVSLTQTPGGRRFVNIAEVSGIDPDGTRVTDTASDDVDVFTPAISLDKTVNGADTATIDEGDPADYTYVVTNEGNTPLGTVDLVDDTPPCQDPTLTDDGDGDAVLGLGESWTYTCTASPDSDVVNTADVTAVPLNPVTGNPFPAPNPPVTDQDPASVVVVNAGIDLTKIADPDLVLLAPGANPPAETVTYTFEATNTGTSPLTRPDGDPTTDPGWLDDAQCNDPATYVSGDTDGDDLLDPQETWIFTCENSVAARTVNVATITGQPTNAAGDPLPVAPVTDDASALVDVQQPALTVAKSSLIPVVLDPDAPAFDGPDVPTPRPASYRYEIGNPGDVPLSLAGTPPEDDKCAPLTFVEGDTDSDDLLDPDEIWLYTCENGMAREDAGGPPGDLPATVVNTVDVVGVPSFDGGLVDEKSVTGSATAEVVVIEPSLELTKTASTPVVRVGGSVSYTVTVENTGTSGLQLTGLSDDKCGLVYQSGDTDGDEILDGADTTPETWTYTCSRAIQATGPGGTDTNLAGVAAVDALGNEYADTDTATVRVISPAIALTKTVDRDLVPAGTPVTYTFEARNVGTSDVAVEDVLDNVTLVDAASPALPGCRQPTLIAKEGGNQDDVLDRVPAEVWRYQCSAPIDAVTNNVGLVGAIGGRPVGLRFAVADWDAVRVQPFHPGIHVEKKASPTHLEGPGKVTYTYRVTNTGDVPLANVAGSITDDTCSPVRYVSGDLDADGLLDTPTSIFEDRADETWIFKCTTKVDEDTKNVVVVSGAPTDETGSPLCPTTAPCDPQDQDHATVHVAPEPGVGPDTGGNGNGGGGGGHGGGGLGDTGAPPWLYQILVLGLLLAGGGIALIVAGVRRPDVS